MMGERELHVRALRGLLRLVAMGIVAATGILALALLADPRWFASSESEERRIGTAQEQLRQSTRRLWDAVTTAPGRH